MILWLDDDIFYSLTAYIDELEEEYDVKKVEHPDQFWDFLEEYKNDKKIKEIQVILLDIHLPIGKREKEADRLYVGLTILEILKGDPLFESIPIILFSAFNDQKIENVINTYKNKGCFYYEKQSTLPIDLVKKINDLTNPKS